MKLIIIVNQYWKKKTFNFYSDCEYFDTGTLLFKAKSFECEIGRPNQAFVYGQVCVLTSKNLSFYQYWVILIIKIVTNCWKCLLSNQTSIWWSEIFVWGVFERNQTCSYWQTLVLKVYPLWLFWTIRSSKQISKRLVPQTNPP